VATETLDAVNADGQVSLDGGPVLGVPLFSCRLAAPVICFGFDNH
jgi:hypothetical protein